MQIEFVDGVDFTLDQIINSTVFLECILLRPFETDNLTQNSLNTCASAC